ncbi:hypothetical protein X975_19998, partial [Stegodyphus mimosarum]
MSLRQSDILENLIVGYVKVPCLLKEQAERRIAFELCRHDELASFFQEQGFANHCTSNQFKEWKKTIEKKSVALCEKLPLPREVKSKVIIAVKSIALQLLIWRTHHQELFHVLPDFTSRFLTSVDWFTEGILNGKKLAEYLVQNTGIPIYQRYRIACIYCLKQYILSLWNQISSEQKNFCISEDFHDVELVSLWSRYIAGREGRFIGNEDLFWQDAFEAAIKGGQKTAAIHCWKALNESTKEEIIVSAASDLAIFVRDKKELEPGLPMTTYYMDISCFLLSEMNEDQRIELFQETSKNHLMYALEYFLEWPHQEFFLPVINILWDIIDEWVYGELLVYIATKHADPDEYHDYDYGSLLEAVLAQTPESYKRYLFHTPNRNTHSKAEMLLLIITKIESFDNRDLGILQRILNMATEEEKLSLLNSNSDIQLCECLITEGNLELFDLVLKQCLPEEDINDFRKQYVLSSKGHFHYSELIWNNELKEADLFLEWGSLSAEEICEFKAYIFNKFQTSFVRSIANHRLDFVDKLLNFFLPCADAQKQFKKNMIEEYGCILCFNFLQEAKWEELDKVLFWCLESEESVEKFKQEIFPVIATDIHFLFMCNSLWEDAVLFFQYFHLSPKDIEKLKSDTLMSHDVFNRVYDMLFNDDDDQTIQLFLKWCFSDKQTLEEFSKRVKQKCKLGKITAKKLHMLQKVDNFVKERLHDLADAQQGKTESHCWKNKRNSSEETGFFKRKKHFNDKYSHPCF